MPTQAKAYKCAALQGDDTALITHLVELIELSLDPAPIVDTNVVRDLDNLFCCDKGCLQSFILELDLRIWS